MRTLNCIDTVDYLLLARRYQGYRWMFVLDFSRHRIAIGWGSLLMLFSVVERSLGGQMSELQS
jgi:hypothetical protein